MGYANKKILFYSSSSAFDTRGIPLCNHVAVIDIEYEPIVGLIIDRRSASLFT